MKKKFYLPPDIRELIIQKIDRISLLQMLGAERVKPSTGGRIRSTCPIHGGDNPTAFCLLPDTHFECNTHQCDDGKKQDIFSLVQRCRDLRFPQAVAFVASMAGVHIDMDAENEITDDAIESMKWSTAVKRQRYPMNAGIVIPEDVIRNFILQRSDYLKGRGFEEWVLNDFEIGHCFDWKGIDGESRVVFPIRDPKGICVGLQGRCVAGKGLEKHCPDDPYPRDKKYDNTKDMSKMEFFYNQDRAFHAAMETGILNLIEGPTNVMWLHQHGLLNSVAPLGVGISFDQIKVLCSLSCRIMIMMDADNAGESATKKLVKSYNHLFDFDIGAIPKSKDIQNCSGNEIYDIYTHPRRMKVKDDGTILLSGT